jgi:imidazolonepropionase-like amidohydrolase
MFFTHAKIHTMDGGRIIRDGYIETDGDTIRRIGDMSELCAVDSDQVMDLHGGVVLPALIDAHSHLGIFNDGLNHEGDDGNESTDPVTPQMRAIDGIYNADTCFRESYEGGVGVVMTGPGSANVLGGQFVLLHTYEKTVERALIMEPAAQKAALGENPKTVHGKENKTPCTRMGTASVLREALFRAREYATRFDTYHRKLSEFEAAKNRGDEDLPDEPDKPDFDFQSDSLLSVIRGELPLKIHAHRQDDILTAVRIANEFGLVYSIEHCTEGYLIADVLFEEFVSGQEPGRGTGGRVAKGGRLLGVVVGPILGDRSKPELSEMTIKSAGILSKAGIPVSIMTDHPCVPEQYLLLSAAIAVRGGMPEEDALAAITTIPAGLLGIGDRLGSLIPGKQADFAVYSGDPLDVRSQVRLFVGKGLVRYDPYESYRDRDRRSM